MRAFLIKYYGTDQDPRLEEPLHTVTTKDRYGLVTRGAALAEDLPGGFAGVYRVLAGAEESGKVRRGYFVEGLGAAQFATTGAVDALRQGGRRRGLGADEAEVVVLAATDPANPYGAALPWPAREAEGGHQPGRKAGAVVVLVDGDLVLYVERGGRTLLTWSHDPDTLAGAAAAIADAVRRGALGRITVEKADGETVLGTDHPIGEALAAAGFHLTPRGLRFRR